MLNTELKNYLTSRVLPNVKTPGQYLGGELNIVRKDHRQVAGKLCLAFPDAYTIGMSHHGLQVLYTLMNAREDWACERAFTPWPDMEEALRRHELPLYSLETFTPLGEFDVVGFSLQYEVCYTNILTMLDLAGVPLFTEERSIDHPLIVAGGPCRAEPGADGALLRRVRHRRRRAKPARNLRPVAEAEAGRPRSRRRPRRDR